jgi:putative DNA primase/helicase
MSESMISQRDVVAQFADAMRAAGLIVNASDIVTDSQKFQRCKSEKDKGSRKNGYYKLWMDGRPAGVFGIWSTGESHTWSADTGAAPMSADEQAKLRAEMKRKQAERAAEIKEAQAKAADRAKKIWDKATQATDDHPYLRRKGVHAHGLRVGKWWKWDAESGKPYVACENALLVPMYGLKRDIRSLQAIFPDKVEIYGDLRDKDYLSSGERSGVFHVIGKPQEVDGRKVVIVVEGYATGATIHEESGHCVLVAFDTGNLLHTAKVFRDKYPDAVICFAADNDWGTISPVNNPGVHYARKAAAAVNGVVAIPQFADASDLPKGGDFNDLFQREGAGAVEALINASLYPGLETRERPRNYGQDAPIGEQGGVPAQHLAKARPKTAHESADQAAREVERDGGFTILGYDRGEYFIFAHAKKQILDCTRSSFSVSGLLEIADLNFWELKFPNKQGVNANAAANFIIQTAHRRGIYDRARVRAGGAWIDEGRHVFHHGDYLSVDGVSTDVTDIRSKYVYEQTLPLPPPSDTPLSDADGTRIFDISKMFRWRRDSSAALLAGWTFLSPICGALKWRPHIWLTGPAGNGKSTILQRFVYSLLGNKACEYAQGNSTESGVRQALGSTSVPVLLDEAEKNSERESQRVESMLSLIRQSSSESDAKTLKGTISGSGMAFHIRSMFCLASIYVGMDKKADIDRLAVLTLKTSRGDPEAATNWVRVKEQLHWMERDTDLRGRMLRRVIDMMPTVLQNIEVFVRVAAKKFGSQRDGDQ